jgi:hypothetical protein
LFYVGKENKLIRAQPSLTHLYVVRGILANRIQIFSSDAAEYIQPFLSCLNSNEPYDNIAPRATTSYEQVVERRGAELIIRIASNLQYMKDALDIIGQVNDIDFMDCNQKFIDQVENLIQLKYGSPVETSTHRAVSTTNIESNLIISKETCMEAVSLFFAVLMPEHFIIMNHRSSDENKETLSELQLQTKILKVNYRIFHKTTLFGNIGALKNVDKDVVDHLLSRLVKRGILKKGVFLKSENAGKYVSYLKYLPHDVLEEQHLIIELNKHHLSMEEYREIYRISDVSPAGTVVTPDGNIELKKQNINFIRTNDVQQQRSVPLISSSSTNLGQIHNGKCNDF